MIRFKKIKKYGNILIAVCALLAMVFGINEYARFDSGLRERKIRGSLLETLINKKSQLEKSLYSRIYYTKSVAAYISVTPGNSKKAFYQIANEFLKNDTVISTMALSKDCIIGAIEPLRGHEKALGLDLLAHPKRKQIVEQTVRTRNTFVAGPVELVEGGIAFISYTPIFTKEKGEEYYFWGVTDIVIYRDKLFNEAHLVERDENFKFALRGVDGSGSRGEYFWGDSTIFANDPVTVDISLPTGTWTLASIPHIGWSGYIKKSEQPTLLLYGLAFIIAILIWLLARALQKIRQNEQELKALFGAMEDLIFVFNRKGEYVKIAPTNEANLVRPRRELLGKTLYEVFDKEEAEFFMKPILECLNTKRLVLFDYPIQINRETRWFQARLTPLTEETVMFVSHDNTEKKLQQDSLVFSEKELKHINETKDKFFSIIAHDLRSPFHGLLNLTGIMAEENADLTIAEYSRVSRLLHISATNLFKLINNLLDWAQLQRGKMPYEPKTLNLAELVSLNTALLAERANQKGIKLIAAVPPDLSVTADERMLNSVLRNLLANAIKYSGKGQTVTIEAAQSSDGSTTVKVSDEGIGMEKEILDRLFEIGEQQGQKGTDDEPGTGLGLVLCKEFVVRHGGQIEAVSRKGAGSTFIFTLQH